MDEKNQNQENLEAKAETGVQEQAPETDSAAKVEETAAEHTETTQKPEPSAPRKKTSVFRGNKFKRGGMATVMTVIFIAVVIVVNLLVSVLSDRFPSMNIDLTAQGMNTLSEQALDVAKNVSQKTEITLIGTEEAYRNESIYSRYGYGLKSSQVLNLAERLQEINQNIQVQFVDPDTNPEFISRYASENLTSGRVLVSTEKRHKVLSVDDLFSISQNSNTGSVETFSKVDSALAAAIEMVNMEKVPVLTLATGHNEMLTRDAMSSFMDMMESQNFDIQEVDILTGEISADTQILMIPTPTTDYTEEELQKLRDLLADESRAESIALLVTFYPGQAELPNLSAFLEEWGVSVNTNAVVMESDSGRYALADPRCALVDATGKSLQDNTYERLVSPLSVPLTLLFSGNGDVGTDALWTTSSGAYVVTQESSEADMENPDTAEQVVASLSSEIVKVDGNMFYRSVIVFGSSNVFSDTFMQTAFDNSRYLMDLMKFATDTDGSEVSVLTHQVQTNIMDVTASQNTIMMLGLGVFTIALPILILIVGLGIFLKRRHL